MIKEKIVYITPINTGILQKVYFGIKWNHDILHIIYDLMIY